VSNISGLWTPFGNASERIKISPVSILTYCEKYPKIKETEIIEKFKDIFKIKGRNSENDYKIIEEQIHQNLRFLIENNILKKENGYYLKNGKIENSSIF